MKIWAYEVEPGVQPTETIGSSTYFKTPTKRDLLRMPASIYQIEVSPTTRSVEVAGTREHGFNGWTAPDEVARRNRCIHEGHDYDDNHGMAVCRRCHVDAPTMYGEQ